MKKSMILSMALFVIILSLLSCSENNTTNSFNNPPGEITSPHPSNQSNYHQESVELRWTYSNSQIPDLSYDLYFGVTHNPVLLAQNISTNSFTIDSLEEGMHYYWKIIARDPTGVETESEQWTFTAYPSIIYLGRFPQGYDSGYWFTTEYHSIDNYVYYTNNYGLNILDISNPILPILINTIPPPDSYSFIHIASFTNRVYVSSRDNGIYVFDITNPAVPDSIDVLFPNGMPYFDDFVVDEQYVYGLYGLSSHYGDVYIYNFTDTLATEPTGIYTPEAVNIGDYTQIKLHNDYLYITYYDAVDIVDVSDKSNPHRVSLIEIDHFYIVTSLTNDLLFMIDGWDKMIYCYNISDPSSPDLVLEYQNESHPGYIFAEQDFIYIADGDGLNIFEYDADYMLEKVGNYQTDQYFMPGGGLARIQKNDDFLLLAYSSGGEPLYTYWLEIVEFYP